MARQTGGLSPALHDYLLQRGVRDTPLLQALRAETAQLPLGQMQISPEQGQFMAWLMGVMGARRTLEVGVFTGYSALVVALALPEDGQVVACDVNPDTAAIAQRYWAAAGVAQKVQLYLGPAIATLQSLLAQGQGNQFDFAFIDADKSHYDDYYELTLQLVRPGGVIALDNTLWSGRVADPQVMDNRTQHLRCLNEKIHQDHRVDMCLLPLSDGLSLVQKR